MILHESFHEWLRASFDESPQHNAWHLNTHAFNKLAYYDYYDYYNLQRLLWYLTHDACLVSVL